MKKYNLEKSENLVLDSVICDRCKRRLGLRERQEALTWQNTGGYNSVFGDGAEISLDLCQGCVAETLGDWIQVIKE